MWLYHVPYTICVVSVLEIAFCDKKKSLTIFYLNFYFFFSSILRILTKRGRQVCCFSAKYTALRARAQTGWHGNRIMCLSGATCLSRATCLAADC